MVRGSWCAAFSTLLGLASIAGCSGSSSSKDVAPSETVDSICTAGKSRCDGLNVKVCSEDGTTEAIQATCLPSQSCSEGACRDTECIPNASFCKDGSVWVCDSTGGGSAPAELCRAGTFCRESEGAARCSDQACTPLAPLCDGTVATTCLADGSGPRPGGMDCASTGEACYGGECRDISCTSGMKLCQHDDVYLCAQSGTEISLFADCRDDEVCDGAMGACRTKLCEPGKSSCDGSRIATCNEYGSAWLKTSTDCAATSTVCVEGSCRERACSAGRNFCDGGEVYSCDSTGTVATLIETCRSGTHCEASSSFAYCQVNQCVAGEVFCSENTVMTCTKDGQYPNQGVPCKEGEYCSGRSCQPLGCTAGQYYCEGSDLYYCYEHGPYLEQTCPATTRCQALPNGATCAPLPCDPGSVACLGEKVGTCAEDGLSLSTITADCSESASICGADFKCAKSTTDTLGVAESVEPTGVDIFMGDVIDVASARRLTELSFNLVLAGSRRLRWVVYEQSGNTFTARIDKVASNVTGTGFISSGALSYALKAGRRYVLGVVISGGDGVAYVDAAPLVRPLSFGTLFGRANVFYSSTFDAQSIYPDAAYQLKVTTEGP